LDVFERAVLPYMDDAYTLARYLMRNEHDAQDAVQDAFLRALRYFDAFAISDVRAWLLAIVRHCCFSSGAKHRGEVVEYNDELHGVVDPAPNPEMLMIAGSVRDAIQAALDELPAEFREVIVLREIQDLSYKEISQVIGAPIGTVMSRLSRARRRLAETLGGSSQAAG
jgi:RNA polymerase sigma-70 factor (ECF subfamily)